MAIELTAKDIQAEVDRLAEMGGTGKHLELKSGEGALGGVVTMRSGVDVYMNGAIIHTVDGERFHFPGGLTRSRLTGGTGVHKEGTPGELVLYGGSYTDRAVDFRIDNLELIGYGYTSGGIRGRGNNRGLIDHIHVKNTKTPYNNGFGYGIMNDGDLVWIPDASQFVGSLDCVVVQDSEFEYCRHAVANNRGARTVFRRNYCHNGILGQQVDAHGGYQAQCATVFLDAYDNVIEAPLSGDNRAMKFRGGALILAHGNTIDGYKWTTMFAIETSNMPLEEALKYKVKGYEWANTTDGSGPVIAYGEPHQTYLKEGRDVYFNTPFPGYTEPPEHPLLNWDLPEPEPEPEPIKYYIMGKVEGELSMGANGPVGTITINLE